MKHILELRDTEFVYGDQKTAWVELTVETGVAEGPWHCDVQLALGEKVYDVGAMDLIVLGRAMEAYLEQRRAAEVVDHQTGPHIQYMA